VGVKLKLQRTLPRPSTLQPFKWSRNIQVNRNIREGHGAPLPLYFTMLMIGISRRESRESSPSNAQPPHNEIEIHTKQTKLYKMFQIRIDFRLPQLTFRFLPFLVLPESGGRRKLFSPNLERWWSALGESLIFWDLISYCWGRKEERKEEGKPAFWFTCSCMTRLSFLSQPGSQPGQERA